MKKTLTSELTQHRIGLLKALLLVLNKRIDSQIPPLTKDNKMIPERIRWQRKQVKHNQKIQTLSELTTTDKEGKEQEYAPEENELIATLRDDRKELNDSVPNESPYRLSFPWIEMREAIYWRLNDQDRRLFEYLYFDNLSYKQITKREGLSVRQIRNRERKLAEKAFGPHLWELLDKKRGRRRRSKLLAAFMLKKYSKKGSGRGLKA